MDESDDDFNELCSKLLRRVRKKGAKEDLGETRTQKEASSIQKKSKLKRTKLPPKTKISHDSTEKKTELGKRGPAPGNEGRCEVTSHESRVASTSKREGDILAATQKEPGPQPSQPKTWTGVVDDSSQTASHCLTALLPSVSKPRAAELVLRKMQQFKRTDPERLKHAPEDCSVETVLKENVSESSQEEDTQNSGNMPGLTVTESDAALALALQQEFGQETPQNSDSLEQEGLFFCQICQKDLSAMNAVRREQHVNRCLDESEKSLEPASIAPKIPECPICGKPFTTSKSRNSHLKQCAVKMEVSPQQLVQAVRLQTFQPDENFPSASSKPVSESKRKGSTNEKKPQKRRKISKTEAMSEDLLVAMAMSHSLMEQSKTVTNDNLGNVFPNNMRPGAEKKSRKRKLVSPPQLLVQDSETYLQQIQDRIAILLTEEFQLSSTPPLPLSKILKEEMGKAPWCLLQPEEKQGILWKGSSLTGAWPLESFYTKGLDPPILPWKPTKNSERGPLLPLMAFSQSKPDVQDLPAFSDPTSEGFNFKTPEEPNSRRQSLSGSQKDHQTLQVLIDLAGEGLTLTQWNSGAETHSRSLSGKDLESCDLPLTGFVLSPREKKHWRSSNSALSLSLLSADFGAMVNNPHLSDVQFQMDSGDVLYAHMFVLYARCPRLIQLVHSEGFFVVEDGSLRTRRVLLNEVSTETAHMFLQYLYTADTNIPSHMLGDLQSLAIRFGVKELVDLCESGLEATDIKSEGDVFLVGKEEKDCESRAENFQELLRSMWVDEDKESEFLLKPEDQEEDDREKVNEEEMEEIYEFAATQRKMLQGKCQTKEDSLAGQPEVEIPVFGCLPTNVKFKKQLDNTYKIDSSEQVKGQEPSVSSNVNIKHFTPVPCQEEIPDDKSGTESSEKDCSPKSAKGGTHSSTSDLLVEGKGGSLREKLTFLDSLHDFDLDKSCDQLFSVTQEEYYEPSQVNCNPKKQNENFLRKEVSSSPVLCQTPPLQPDFPLSHIHCQSPSSSKIFPQCRHDSSPLSPQLKRKFSNKVSPPVLAEQQKKNSDIHTLYEDPACKDNSECNYIANHKKTAALISPVKPPSIDLTKPKSCQRLSQSNIRSQNSSSQVNKDDDIILLLDSDEEMELEQTKMKPVSDSLCGERKTPRTLVGKGEDVKNSPKSSKPFLIIDIDSDQMYSQNPIATEVGVHRDRGTDVLTEMQSHRKGNSCLDEDFRLISKHDNSREESSSTDTSWLVPATPLTNKSRDCSSQMRVTSIIARPRVSSLQDKVLQCKTKVLIENKNANEITNEVSINVPQPSSHLVPITSETKSLSETSVSERYSYRSPAIQYSKVNKNLSTVVPIQLSPEPADLIKQSLENPSSHTRLSSADDKPVLIQNVCSEVVEVVDSEEEQDLDPCPLSSSLLLNSDPPIPVDDDYWNIEPLSPIPIDNLNLERTGHLSANSPNKVCETMNNRERNSPATPSRMSSAPVYGSPVDKRRSLHCNEKTSLCAGSPGNSNLSYLNSALWDDWDGEQKSTEILPLAKRLSNEKVTQELEVLKTPKAVDRKTNRPPKVPITPMPSYSIMETPELKKELNRFGVRPLPKRQMVLKLKEIFQYTHQILPSDSEDEIQALQTSPRMMAEPCCLTQTASQVKTSGAVNELPPASSTCALPSVEGGQSEVSENLSTISHRKLKNLTKAHSRRKQARKAALTLTQPPAEDVHSGSASDNQLSMSQKSITSSTDESENSFGSQSSIASEFETVFESEGEEEEEITASQAAAQDADREEAARRYIRSRPALYQKILLYQPFELADLQAELRQNGIKFAMGKLLDFLDAHCITFTTAGARKEKLKKKLPPGGKKRGKCY